MNRGKEVFRASYTLGEIVGVAKDFWRQLKDHRIFAFSGEMGAGKTTFIHHLCELLEVEDVVSSPTFALINEYHFPDGGKDRVIYHLDWYRLRDAAEAINAGMEDCITEASSGNAICLVEWPEKAPELLRAPYLIISIASPDPQTREMVVNEAAD